MFENRALMTIFGVLVPTVSLLADETLDKIWREGQEDTRRQRITGADVEEVLLASRKCHSGNSGDNAY